jgi:hypothetical protein
LLFRPVYAAASKACLNLTRKRDFSVSQSPPARWSKRSLSAQALGKIDEATRAVVPPIHLSTTFIRDPDNGYSAGFIVWPPRQCHGPRG